MDLAFQGLEHFGPSEGFPCGNPTAGAEIPLPPAPAADPKSESGEATSHNKIPSDFQ
jgi:hypothetical protein